MTKYITDAAIVVSFEQDNFIRLKQTKAEESYKNIIDKPSVNTNQPDSASASIPRIIIKDSSKGIAISQNAAQIAMMFGKNSSIDAQTDDLLNTLDLMFEDTKNFQGEDNIQETGFLVSVAYTTDKPIEELSTFLFNNFSNFEPLGNVINAVYKFGFNTENNLYVGIEFGGYRVVHGPEETNAEKKANAAESESVYLFKIDINNKPLIQSKVKEPSEIKNKFKSIINGGLEKLTKNLLI
jgi:hypothetical protein